MNQPHDISSSGSEEEDLSYIPGYGPQPTDQTEDHTNKHCKYKRYRVDVQGKEIYMHIRICKCRNFTDRGYLAQQQIAPVILDGIEIHCSPGCKWKRSKTYINGRRFYTLHAFCNGCNTSQTAHPSSAMNSKFHFLYSMSPGLPLLITMK